MKRIFNIYLIVSLLTATPCHASIFGEETAVLAQILINAIQQLAQLRQLLSAGEDSLSLMRDINRGINDSLNLYRTIFPNGDPGIYKDWDKAQDAIQKLETIYGIVVPSPDQKIQRDADQSVAEAVTLNNSIYDYSKKIDEIGEEVKAYSHSVSPGGAQKLSAQTLGVILHVLNQSLRAQATGLKLQAQTVAIENHRDKQWTQQALGNAQDLKTAMQTETATFALPQF